MSSIEEDPPIPLAHALNEARSNPGMSAFCDVVFVVQGERFPCHRNVLAVSSPHFRAMFTDNMNEASSPDVPLHDLDPDVWRATLNYVYTEHLDHISCINQAIVRLECAHRFQFRALVRALLDLIAFKFFRNPSAGWTVFEHALRFEHEELLEMTTYFVKKELFVSSWHTKAFFMLSADTVEFLVKSDDLRVGNELTVFNALLFWFTGCNFPWGEQDKWQVESMCQERLHEHSHFVQYVKLEKMHVEELKQVAKTARPINYHFWDEAVKKLTCAPVPEASTCAVDTSHYIPRSRGRVDPITFTHRIYGISEMETTTVITFPRINDTQSGFNSELKVTLHDASAEESRDCIEFHLCVPAKFTEHYGRVQFFTMNCGSLKATDVIEAPRKFERVPEIPVVACIKKGFHELKDPGNHYLDVVDDSITVGVTVYLR